MSVAEVERYLKGVEWRMKLQAQFDYSLADLIGISAARMVSNDVKFPAIEEVYPNIRPVNNLRKMYLTNMFEKDEE